MRMTSKMSDVASRRVRVMFDPRRTTSQPWSPTMCSAWRMAWRSGYATPTTPSRCYPASGRIYRQAGSIGWRTRDLGRCGTCWSRPPAPTTSTRWTDRIGAAYRFVLRATFRAPFRAATLATRCLPLTVFRGTALFAAKVFFTRAAALRNVAPAAFAFFPTAFCTALLTAFLALATFARASARTPLAPEPAARRMPFIPAFAAPYSALATFLALAAPTATNASLDLARLPPAWATTPRASAAAACPMPCIVATAESNAVPTSVLFCSSLLMVLPQTLLAQLCVGPRPGSRRRTRGVSTNEYALNDGLSVAPGRV